MVDIKQDHYEEKERLNWPLANNWKIWQQKQNKNAVKVDPLATEQVRDNVKFQIRQILVNSIESIFETHFLSIYYKCLV